MKAASTGILGLSTSDQSASTFFDIKRIKVSFLEIP